MDWDTNEPNSHRNKQYSEAIKELDCTIDESLKNSSYVLLISHGATFGSIIPKLMSAP